jgi:osmotically-inducible protein OsmY
MDKNQNQGSRSWRSNQEWNQNRNRFNQQNEQNQNREDYNSGYGYNQGRGASSRRDYRSGMEEGNYDRLSNQDYSRTNYMPDNDENRYENDPDYESTQYGTSGTYGYRGSSGMGAYGQGYSGMGSSAGRSNYGSMGQGSSYGRQSWQQRENENPGNYGAYGTGYGSGYGSGNYGSESNYGRMTREGRENMYRGEGRYGREGRNQDRNWWERTRDEVSSWFGDDEAERRREMDKYYEGGYRGKGPKTYHRSEERIKEDVCDRLTYDDRLDASDIEIEVHSDEVILTGRVDNRMQKRRAEDLVESVPGVRNVENRLRVGQSNVTTYSDSTSGTSGMYTQSRERNIE